MTGDHASRAAHATAALKAWGDAMRPTPSDKPTNAVEASARLAHLNKDAAWRSRYLSGDAAAASEFNSLNEQVAAADPVDQNNGAVISDHDLPAAAAHLRDIGHPEHHVSELMHGTLLGDDGQPLPANARHVQGGRRSVAHPSRCRRQSDDLNGSRSQALPASTLLQAAPRQPRRPARKRGKGDGPPKRRGEPAGAVCWCWPGLCRKSAPLARIMPPPHLITFFQPRLSRKNATIPKCSAGGRVVWRRAVVAASSLFSCVVLLAALLTTDSARGADLPPPPPPPPPPVVPVYKAPDPILSVFYTGGAFNWVHHTGYVPNSTQADTAQYTVGFKVFGGYRFTRQNSVEVTYHYLGQVNIEGLPIPTTERAWAISGSFVHVSPPFSQWIGPGPWNDYLHAFVRLGLAYKHVEQSSALGTIDEGFLSGVIGAGIQAQFTPQWFGRIEYEFLSTAIGGPPQSVPGFKGLYQVKIGGTNRVDNVMNTPIAITLGYNF